MHDDSTATDPFHDMAHNVNALSPDEARSILQRNNLHDYYLAAREVPYDGDWCEEEALWLLGYAMHRPMLQFRAHDRTIEVAEETTVERLAVHEAGHAVAAFCCDQSPQVVTISPKLARIECGERFRGFMRAQWLRRSRTDTWKSVLIGVAGVVAEGRKYGMMADGGKTDMERVLALATKVTSGPKRRHAYIDRAFVRVDEILGKNWNYVESLAAALVEHETLLGGKSVLAMFGKLEVPV